MDGVGYGVVYSLLDENPRKAERGSVVNLVKTLDGIHYENVTMLDLPDFPNETTVRFLPDKRMLMMVREDSGDLQGYWGISDPPYTEWSFKKIGLQLGGPDFIVLDDQTIIAGTRSYFLPGSYKTLLAAACTRLGGHLAIINDEAEFDEVTRLADEQGLIYVWIGAHRVGGVEKWENGSDLTDGYVKWARGEPTYIDRNDQVAEDYIMLWKNNGDWVYNDNRDDPYADYPNMFEGIIGYVCEFND